MEWGISSTGPMLKVQPGPSSWNKFDFLLGVNPIRPAPVPQRHYHHKIVCQIYMNGLNGLSFHDFSSWILLCPLKKSNLQYLYKIFWKIKFWTYLVSLNFESKMEEFVKKLTYWVRMLTFFTCGLEFVHDRYQQA